MPVKPEHKVIADKFISTDHKGKPISPVHRQAMLHSNPMIARVLVARAQTLTDQERESLKSVLTPQSMSALKKLLPELSKLLDAGINNANAG